MENTVTIVNPQENSKFNLFDTTWTVTDGWAGGNAYLLARCDSGDQIVLEASGPDQWSVTERSWSDVTSE